MLSVIFKIVFFYITCAFAHCASEVCNIVDIYLFLQLTAKDPLQILTNNFSSQRLANFFDL